MGFYNRYILPRLTHLAMRQKQLKPYRDRVVSTAEGRVLEVGIGPGLNLPLYSNRVERVIGIDPSPELLEIARRAGRGAAPEVELVEGVAEAIPLEDDSVDCVIITWTLCSVSEAEQALGEIRRVLKPHGAICFAEHGRAPEERIQRWQDRLTPLWKRCSGNCHLNRPIASLVEANGFRMERLETGYAKGPKPMAFMYEGIGRPR